MKKPIEPKERDHTKPRCVTTAGVISQFTELYDKRVKP